MSMQNIELKMNHAESHLKILINLIIKYLDSDPLGMVELPDSTVEITHHRVKAVKPIPPEIALICGHCLQNLRSTLDYLVHELVLSNGGKPNIRHMFPVALTPDKWDREVLGDRLKGINTDAFDRIKALQPMGMANPKASELYLVDHLTNLNKHRRPILTGFQGTERDLIYDIPHIVTAFSGSATPDGPIIRRVVKFWVAFGEEAALHMEVATTLEIIFAFMRNEVLPLFEPFLH